ncbi:hypothetical protein MRX96_048492 [Rhipicephalus microplus]
MATTRTFRFTTLRRTFLRRSSLHFGPRDASSQVAQVMRAEYCETMLPVLRSSLMLLADLMTRFHASVMKPLLPLLSVAAVVVLGHFGHLQMAPDGNGSSGQHLLESQPRKTLVAGLG